MTTGNEQQLNFSGFGFRHLKTPVVALMMLIYATIV